MVILKAIVSAFLLATARLLIGPIVALMVMPFPDGACRMYWIIPATVGAVSGIGIGGTLGFVLGLIV